jgi:RNA polymerase sigma factor (sigma-70 family)
MDTTENVLKTVERLSPRLQAIAWHVADELAGYRPEDAYQDMLLTLTEQARREPDFLEQKDAYILSKCSWEIRNKAESGRVYGKYVESEGEEFELLSDKMPGPEQAVEARELITSLRRVVDGLPVKDKMIVSLLVIDCTPAEIARRLKVSRSAICQRLQHVRKSLADYVPA